MQQPPGQDLPHTRTHAVHWLATGVALGAVVVAASLVQPAGASATTAGDDGSAATAPKATAVRYPLDCAGAPVDVVAQGSADLDADGRTDTVVEVRCHTETGTPPSGVYVLSRGPARRARIVATLVDPARRLGLSDFSVTGRTVSATLLGYSSDKVPRCCPDLARKFSWVWRDGRFRAVPGPHEGTV